MPRQARKVSELNIYHVILRGINRQIIFEEDNDYLQFISILKYYKNRCDFKIYAYCLMNNHIHLLIEHSSTNMETIMKKIEVKFVRWYNTKYQRVGHLFQDRYKSEPINDMRYFLTVFRYINQNPFHAGLESVIGTYPWSSYQEYLALDDSFIDINKVIKLFADSEECINFLSTDSNIKCMEGYPQSGISDKDALQMIRERTGCDSLAVAVGNVHGVYSAEPKIRFDIIEEVNKEVSVPLVLHGASGIGDEDIKKAIQCGIAKINIHTELCQAAMEAINEHKDEPFLAVERAVRQAVKERAMYKIKLFGDDGRADE